MKKTPYVMITLVLLVSGCGNEAELARFAETCQKAVDFGLLETADEACTNALGGFDDLDNVVKSERLFKLGSIKRQRSLFAQAEVLMKQTLTIEKSLPELDAKKIAHRHYELTVVLAGQNKWQEGAQFLHKLLPEVKYFSDAAQKAIKNMTKRYVAGLEKEGQSQLAESFEIYLLPPDQPSSGDSH